MVRTTRVRLASAVAVLVMTAASAPAQEPKTTTEKIKDSASSAASSVKRGVSSAGDAIKNKYNQARDHVTAMGIEARVYSRLHWDKGLVGAKIDLSSPRAGSIVLTGVVPDAKAQAKAVLVANDTVGVTEVVDHLTVQAATTTTTEPATVREVK